MIWSARKRGRVGKREKMVESASRTCGKVTTHLYSGRRSHDCQSDRRADLQPRADRHCLSVYRVIGQIAPGHPVIIDKLIWIVCSAHLFPCCCTNLVVLPAPYFPRVRSWLGRLSLTRGRASARLDRHDCLHRWHRREGRTTTLHALNNQTVQAFAREAIKEIPEDQKSRRPQLTYVKDAVIDLGSGVSRRSDRSCDRVSRWAAESQKHGGRTPLGILPAEQ